MTATALDAALDQALDHLDDEAPADTRPPAYITSLPVAALFADMSYQRQLDDVRVARMVDDYDPTLLGVLEVSDRGDGRFAIIDGHHRWATVRQAHPRKTDAEVPCNVHRGLTPTTEAQLFYEIDAGRRRLTGWDRWHARKGAGDPAVLAIEAVVERHGLRIEEATRDGAVRATKACTDIVALGGTDLLDSALTVALAGFGNTADALDGSIIHGVANVLHHYRDEVDVERFIAQCQTIPPRQVKARANALREAQKGVQSKLVACVLIDRYNAAPGRKVEEYAIRVPTEHNKGKGAKGRREKENEAIRAWAAREGITLGRNINAKTRDAYAKAMGRS